MACAMSAVPWSAIFWTDPLGRLWCFFDQSLGYFDGRCGDWFIRCDDPDAAEPQMDEAACASPMAAR